MTGLTSSAVSLNVDASVNASTDLGASLKNRMLAAIYGRSPILVFVETIPITEATARIAELGGLRLRRHL